MTKIHAILIGPLLAALLGTAFCIWSALGNAVNFCVTTGCTLYQDFTILGISLWWIGSVAFASLAACALLGQRLVGKFLAALYVLGDIGFLLLMAFTAPCISCLVAAGIFAISYWLFRRTAVIPARVGEIVPRRHSVLLWAWVVLFVINIGQVGKSEINTWALLDESGDPATRMFFSVGCPYCIEGINALSGKVDVAYYPVPETPDDVYRIAAMLKLLEDGLSIDEALEQSANFEKPAFFTAYSPEMILLRFRLLRNKAHLFASGSQSVPFFEQKGLPADLAAKAAAKKNPQRSQSGKAAAYRHTGDYNLPEELTTTGQCGGGAPCSPEEENTIN